MSGDSLLTHRPRPRVEHVEEAVTERREARRRDSREILAALRSHGLLLVQDRTLPSVVGLVTGESPRGSWWSHPNGRAIFAILSDLADDDDVLFTKLLEGKVTLVHRRLWPALLAVARSREPWQLERLSPAAGRLLRRLDRAKAPIRSSGAAVKELERRLLAVTRQVHAAEGRHELALQRWTAWSAEARCRPLGSVARAKRAVERAAASIGASARLLPWSERPERG
jgi:hypothetical protein